MEVMIKMYMGNPNRRGGAKEITHQLCLAGAASLYPSDQISAHREATLVLDVQLRRFLRIQAPSKPVSKLHQSLVAPKSQWDRQ